MVTVLGSVLRISSGATVAGSPTGGEGGAVCRWDQGIMWNSQGTCMYYVK